MKKILISDIFGKTPSLVKLSKDIDASKILDPYYGSYQAFKDENEAYSYFMAHVGLEKYVTILSKEIAKETSPCVLIGFSVGASAIWKLSEVLSKEHVKSAFCFYGSQIRNALNVKPRFELELIFPKQELHFDVNELITSLTGRKNLNTVKVEYLHGFMSQDSINFNHEGYSNYVSLLRKYPE